MGFWRIHVVDGEAQAEKMAVMEIDAPDVEITERGRMASHCGFGTRLSMVMTEAANGDWKLAQQLCREERERFGEEHARELMRYMQDCVRDRVKQVESGKKDRTPKRSGPSFVLRR